MLVCHCFQYTKEDIEQDVLRHGKSAILERILAEKRQGACRCAVKHPGGT